jgi:LL-diaminopimelate aminotransferase
MNNLSGFQTAKRMEQFHVHFFAKLVQKIITMEKEGIDVIKLDEGSPDLPPSKSIVDSLIKNVNDPTKHSYQPHRGNYDLRNAWAIMFQKLYNIYIDPESEVIPLIGSKEGIVHFPSTYIDPDDFVLIPDPGYISYTRGTQLAGGVPYYYLLDKGSQYLPDFRKIPKSILQKVKIIWLNYPNNPTTAMAPIEYFQEVVEFGLKNHILICHDAAYSQITYDGHPAPSIFQIKDAKHIAVEFHTLSKSHNMAGWRVGALVGSSELIQPFFTLKTNLDSGHFLPIMNAAIEAMTGDQSWLTQRNEIYRQRRDIVINTLHQLNIDVEIPQGSIYVWSSIPQKYNSNDFCSMILDHAHVSFTPGVVFGSNGEGFIRISLTAANERIYEAMERITAIKI